jgi:hypothetical protein
VAGDLCPSSILPTNGPGHVFLTHLHVGILLFNTAG